MPASCRCVVIRDGAWVLVGGATPVCCPFLLSQGNRGRLGVVVAAYMHYSNISAR